MYREHKQDASRYHFKAITCGIFLAGPFALSSLLCGQHTKTTSLSEVLTHLEANLNLYDTKLPSLFCDEHAVSSTWNRSLPDEITTTYSLFRLRRSSQPDHTATLLESRDIRSVNGKPPTSQDMDGPTLLSGMFEGSLAVISLSQIDCMGYTLQRISSKHLPTS